MSRFLLRRIFFEMLPTLLGVITLTWWMVRLAPGGPFDSERPMTAGAKERLQEQFGFDKPLPIQFAQYLGNVARGDLGYSMIYRGTRVTEIIGQQFPTSLALGGLAFLVALSIGLPAGTIAAAFHNRGLDHAVMIPALFGICLPAFVTGPLLLYLLANTQLLDKPLFLPADWDSWRNMVLPVLTLGAGLAAYLARLMRAGMLEASTSDHIRTATAKGASPARVVLIHTLRTGIRPVISFLGPAAAGIITGSVVVETIFQIPGLGRSFINAVTDRDYTLLLGITLFYATLIIVFNTVVDIVLAWLDPRTREEAGV